MLVFTHAMKMSAAALSLAVMLVGAATPSQAQTTGTVRLHFVKVGFIVGVGGGSGVLIYHGHRYRLAVSGIGLGSLGIAAVDLVGTASNLSGPGHCRHVWGRRRRRLFRRRRPGGNAAERQRRGSSVTGRSSRVSGLAGSRRHDAVVAIGAGSGRPKIATDRVRTRAAFPHYRHSHPRASVGGDTKKPAPHAIVIRRSIPPR